MSKRNAPESGFVPLPPTKRHVANTASVHHHDNEDSIQPNPHPRAPAVGNGSTIPVSDLSESLQEPLNDHTFSPPVNDEEEFLLDPEKRQELCRESQNLQTVVSLDLNEEGFPANIPDDADDHCDEDSSEDEQAVTKISTRRTPDINTTKPNNKKHSRYFKPFLWKEGMPSYEAAWIARKSDALICGTTNIALDTEALLVDGTLWKQVLLDELPRIFREEDSIPLPSAQDKYDFLKACYRLGRMIEPTRMSRLLGGGYRGPEYCAFILRGFLGLLHNRKVRRVLGGDTSQKTPERHKDIDVYADQLYPSDDELISNQQAETADLQDGNAPDDGSDGFAVFVESDREEDDNHKDPSHLHNSAVLEIKHKNPREDKFLASPSYVLRRYMSIVMGLEINSIDEFAARCKDAGATFLTDPRWQPKGRLKWLKETVPAPELRPGGAISEPLDLWTHALNTFSVKNLSRCAIIKVNPLLDWLSFAAHEATPTTSEAEYYRLIRPVVAIAPIPLLHLADSALNFALRVLSFAVKNEALDFSTEDEIESVEKESVFTIDSDEVIYAALRLERDADELSYLHTLDISSALGNQGSHTNRWPSLVQRPLTASTNVELCDRVPKASISIPEDVMGELRASLMSLRSCVKWKLYTNPKMFHNKDPLVYASKAEKLQARRKRLQRNRDNGIKWHDKAEEGSKDDDENRITDDPVGNPASPSDPKISQTLAEKEMQPEAQQGEDRTSNVDVAVSCGLDKTASANEHKERTERLPSFFDQVNTAELIASRIGMEKLKERRKRICNGGVEDEYMRLKHDAALFLQESANDQKCSLTTVCVHRLGWICLHALGITIDKSPQDCHPMRYATCVNYTNFADFCEEKPITLTSAGLSCLANLADVHIRREAEILMACAAHDDGRPWIDKADVALVAGVRKEEYRYADL